jgi:hypothetical protein
MLELRLLGPIQFSINDDHSLTLPVRKEEALLAYLATEHGHPHSRDSLVALLWPDAPPENARLSLRVNLAKKTEKGGDRYAFSQHAASSSICSRRLPPGHRRIQPRSAQRGTPRPSP